MDPITEEELLTVIRENPMICTRAIIKKLRPDDFKDNETYLEHIASVKPVLLRLWKDGVIVSSKVQCCTFNLKQWQINRPVPVPRMCPRQTRIIISMTITLDERLRPDTFRIIAGTAIEEELKGLGKVFGYFPAISS